MEAAPVFGRSELEGEFALVVFDRGSGASLKEIFEERE